MLVTRSHTDWIAGLVHQDEAAVEALLQRYWGPAFRVALQVTGDPVSAEDVAQDAFVSVLQGVHRFDPQRPFKPWFFRILLNTARTQRRQRERLHAREARAARPDVDRTEPDAEVEAREETERLRTLLAELSPKLREALALRYLEGLTLSELAEVLECPEGTASSRIRRGLEALRSMLLPATAVTAAVVAEQLGALPAVTAPSAPPVAELKAAAVLTHPQADVDLAQLDLADAPPSPSAGKLMQLAKGGAGGGFKAAPLAATLLTLLVGASTVSVLIPRDETGGIAKRDTTREVQPLTPRRVAETSADGARPTRTSPPAPARQTPDSDAHPPTSASDMAPAPAEPNAEGAAALPEGSLLSPLPDLQHELRIGYAARGDFEQDDASLQRLLRGAIYSTLPQIATEHVVGADTIAFDLTAATWSNGSPVVASDYVDRWNELRKQGPRTWVDRALPERHLRAFERVVYETLGRRRLSVHLPGSTADELRRLLDQAPFLPQAPDSEGLPVTNGPYQFESWEEDRIVLRRRANLRTGPRRIVVERPGFLRPYHLRWGRVRGRHLNDSGISLRLGKAEQRAVLKALRRMEPRWARQNRVAWPRASDPSGSVGSPLPVVATRAGLHMEARRLVSRLREHGISATLRLGIADPDEAQGLVLLAGVDPDPGERRFPFYRTGMTWSEAQGDTGETPLTDDTGALRFPIPKSAITTTPVSKKRISQLLAEVRLAERALERGKHADADAIDSLVDAHMDLLAALLDRARSESSSTKQRSWAKIALHELKNADKSLRKAPKTKRRQILSALDQLSQDMQDAGWR